LSSIIASSPLAPGLPDADELAHLEPVAELPNAETPVYLFGLVFDGRFHPVDWITWLPLSG